ncbi:MAG: hypothetical protein QW207_03360 [Candidatus Micrarchaeaceae archaeon]
MTEKIKNVKKGEATEELKKWLNNYVGGFPVDLMHDLKDMYGQKAVENVLKEMRRHKRQ